MQAAQPGAPTPAVPPARPVVVIGNFDGVHHGHRALLEHARSLVPGHPLVVVTFEPHTMAVVRPDVVVPRLTTAACKLELLRVAGADEVVVLPFDRETAGWSPTEFVDRVLRPLHPAVVAVGDGFRFGHRAKGDISTLTEAGERDPADRFDVAALPLVDVSVRGRRTAVSSTAIRYALEAGDVEGAAEMLGRDHQVSGVVVRGDQRGRALLGYPTANLPADEDALVPADGVYAGWLSGDLRGPHDPPGNGPVRLPAAISVGSNPTFDGVQRRVESYVLDRDDLELYGVGVTVDFAARIRGQVKFDSIEELVTQMRDDVDRAHDLLGVPGPAPDSPADTTR